MSIYKAMDKKYTVDIFYHLEKLKEDLYRLQIERNKDFLLVRMCDSFIDKINTIQTLINSNVRFDWCLIQDEIDKLFKGDPSITGVLLFLDFVQTDKPNRAILKGLIQKKNSHEIS